MWPKLIHTYNELFGRIDSHSIWNWFTFHDADIFNLSFEQGVVPNKFKIARVISIYKSGDKNNLINYIPISILPAFSKIIERAVVNRLTNYFKKIL